MPDNNIKLIWDIEKSQTIINNIAIVIVAENLAPPDIAATVEEQDTALVLGKPGKISVTNDKPSWVLANKLESQDTLEPGSIVIRDGKTIRLLAIVHDLNLEPSWRYEWIQQALSNIFSISRSYGIRTISMPILGTQFGRFPIEKFLLLLVENIKQNNDSFEKIWLTVSKDNCTKALSYLREIAK